MYSLGSDPVFVACIWPRVLYTRSKRGETYLLLAHIIFDLFSGYIFRDIGGFLSTDVNRDIYVCERKKNNRGAILEDF